MSRNPRPDFRNRHPHEAVHQLRNQHPRLLDLFVICKSTSSRQAISACRTRWTNKSHDYGRKVLHLPDVQKLYGVAGIVQPASDFAHVVSVYAMAAGDHWITSLLIEATMLVATNKSMSFRAETVIKMSGL